MAHHLSAKKRVSRNGKRYIVNHARRARVRSFVKKVERAIAKNQPHSEVFDLLKTAQSEMMRGVARGVISKNAGSRKVSRLNAAVKSLSS